MDPYILLLKEIGIDISSEIEPEPEHEVCEDFEEYVEEEYEHWDWGDHVLQNNEPGCERPFAIEYHDES